MKIGFDAKRAFHNNRGLGNYSRDLIRILQENTSDELVLFNPKSKKREDVTITEYTKVITPQSFLGKKLKGLWRLMGITKLAKNEHLDLYHGLSGEIPIGISQHIRSIVTIHDLIFVRYPKLYSFFDRKIHFLKFRYAARKSHHIIAISEQTKQDIITFLGVPEQKISVVYQGCHKAFKQSYSEQQKEQICQKYQLPEQFVLSVGAIEPRKNALEIVKAITNLDISLVLIGKKTKYYDKIQAYCKENQMQDRVIVLENLPMQEIAIIYQMACVFCYPSIFEGFGIPIIEALFSKVPVITSKGSCFPEAAGNHSLYVDLNEQTANQIESHIKTLLSDIPKRNFIIEKGYEYAQNFTDKAVFQNLIKVYQKIS